MNTPNIPPTRTASDKYLFGLEQRVKANRVLLLQVLAHLKLKRDSNAGGDDLETLFSTLNDAIVRIEQLEEQVGICSQPLAHMDFITGNDVSHLEK